MTIHAEAARLHTHTIVFQEGSDEEDCAVLAMLGWSTAAIGEKLGLSPAQVYYRIRKAGLVDERQAYRRGESAMAKYLYRLGRDLGRNHVQKHIAPKFVAYQDR